jgi:hypothetical protein
MDETWTKHGRNMDETWTGMDRADGAGERAQPRLGLEIILARLPRVARAAQPWARWRNPFGIEAGRGGKRKARNRESAVAGRLWRDKSGNGEGRAEERNGGKCGNGSGF